MRLVFIETAVFRASARGVLSDADIMAIEDGLLLNPHAGAVVASAGGVRKVSVGMEGRGKRGGARVIYFYHEVRARVYFLLVYPKNVSENLSAAGKKVLAQMVRAIETER